MSYVDEIPEGWDSFPTPMTADRRIEIYLAQRNINPYGPWKAQKLTDRQRRRVLKKFRKNGE